MQKYCAYQKEALQKQQIQKLLGVKKAISLHIGDEENCITA
ncbi:hypothetical protein A1E_02850 [Rickettsia canadensis str. McKiel]|uniref:Uncharacterized protein n=1 Tax=Rickettsia canadensis (strain McKiel) TaxID=293613 RepID=A8EYS7_RICCK|nr:hypothetical protein [Rickettsia canadensis]ABV73510.1 hypothetical protein A1E_02850 [Rickettsia canadensis str. McKiel]